MDAFFQRFDSYLCTCLTPWLQNDWAVLCLLGYMCFGQHALWATAGLHLDRPQSLFDSYLKKFHSQAGLASCTCLMCTCNSLLSSAVVACFIQSNKSWSRRHHHPQSAITSNHLYVANPAKYSIVDHTYHVIGPKMCQEIISSRIWQAFCSWS